MIDSINLNAYDDKNGKKTQITMAGKIFIGITGGIAVGLTVICAPFVSPALRKYCLPYVPATKHQIENIFTALHGCNGTLIDLGSGDGRIVLEAARHNFNSHGIELNPWLVLFSKVNALRYGLQQNTRFFCKDLWKFHLGPYDNVVIFGVEQMMVDLENKLAKECRKGCNVIACRFPLPNKQPVRVIGSGIDTVWVYTLNS